MTDPDQLVRNLYDPQRMGERGFEYHSIGRPAARPVAADGERRQAERRAG